MTTLRASQCIILTTPPMRTLCGKTDDRLAGITLATLTRLREINRNSQQPDIQFRLCPLCRKVASQVVETEDAEVEETQGNPAFDALGHHTTLRGYRV